MMLVSLTLESSLVENMCFEAYFFMFFVGGCFRMTLDYTDTKTGTKFQAKKSYHVIESGNTISIRARVSFKLQILHC